MEEKELVLCDMCGEPFEPFDGIIIVNEGEKRFHKDCVELYPNGFSVFTGGVYVGEAESDWDLALETLKDNEMLEDDD